MPLPDFPCTKCGACCRRITRVDPSWPKREDGACFFLREDDSCGIYEERPLLCRVNALLPDGVDMADWHNLNATICNMWQEEDGMDKKYRLPVVK